MAVVMVIVVSHGKTPWSLHQSSLLGDGAVSSTSVEQQIRSSGENALGLQQKVRIFVSADFSPNSSWEEEIWEAGVVMTNKSDSFPSDAVARNATMISPGETGSQEGQRCPNAQLPWE